MFKEYHQTKKEVKKESMKAIISFEKKMIKLIHNYSMVMSVVDKKLRIQ